LLKKSLYKSDTREPKQVLDGEPGDADGLDHCQLWVVLRVSILADDADRRNGVDGHGGGRNDDEADRDDTHDLKNEFI